MMSRGVILKSRGLMMQGFCKCETGYFSSIIRSFTTGSCCWSKQCKIINDHHDEAHRNEAVLYVHWPYCARRCTYCNFNKYISGSVDHRRMSDCLCQEAKTLIHLSGVTHINSIFFGGGTPSLALPSTISKVIETVKNMVTFTPGSEVTLEANPTELESERLVEFQQAAINRVSLGIQALNQTDLQILGRDHSVDEALRCVEEAKQLYPGKVSVDMIFGKPGQTVDGWKEELKQIVEICDNHVSLYQLTLERGTQLFKWVQENKYTLPDSVTMADLYKTAILPDSDTMADMYQAAVEILEEAYLQQYEVSNFARKGAESKHNEAYWQGKQYIGIGPGAHGRFFPVNRPESGTKLREARIQTLEPDNWMFEVEKYGHATRKIVPQSVQDQLEEIVSLGLRTIEGVPASRWESLCGASLVSVFGENDMVRSLVDNRYLVLDQKFKLPKGVVGWCEGAVYLTSLGRPTDIGLQLGKACYPCSGGLRATRNGLLVLDSIIPHLLAAMSHLQEIQGLQVNVI